MHNSAALYDDKVPAGCGCEYTKCNAFGHIQQPALAMTKALFTLL